MNKKELLNQFVQYTGLTLKEGERILNAILESIQEAMTKQETVSLTGFGQFGVKIRPSRKGRHPQTGEVIIIAQSIVPFFKVSPKFKKLLNMPFPEGEK